MQPHFPPVLADETAPRVGFGCGGLLAHLSPPEAVRLLETAADLGVTYFDTARMYGEGRAEALLKGVIHSGRDIVVATKVGIAPPGRALHNRVLNKGFAGLRKLVPGVPMPASAAPRFGQFSRAQMQASFQTSLRELGVEQVGVLLLHECSPEAAASDEVRRFIDDLRGTGQALLAGVAATPDATVDIVSKAPAMWDVVQFNNSLVTPTLSRLPTQARAMRVTHSVIAAPAQAIANALAADAQLAKTWKSETGVDPADRIAMSQLLLAQALRANPHGLVLFSTTNAKTLAAQIAAAKGEAVDLAQIDGLERLAPRLFG